MIIQITTVGTVLDESYAYDSISNRRRYVRNHKNYSIKYYKNSAGGNSRLVKNDGTYEYKYDKNGNRILKVGNGETWKYTWDLHNRLIKVEMESNGNKLVEVSYKYDHENNKLTRECDGNVTYYMYDFEGKLLYEKNDNICRSYVYLGSRLVGFYEGENQYYAITDETGSVRKIYEGEVEVWCGTYSPFGKLMSTEGDLEFTVLFGGKEIDPETGLTYHWNRWRNAEGDAFISVDPLRDGYNWYGYANANPFKYADSNGLESYVCRDGTFCSEGDLSNASYRADCYFYNGYNSGTLASMSTSAYSLYNNGGQATLALTWTSATSPSAAEEIKSYGRTIQAIIAENNSFVTELMVNKEELEQNIKLFVLGYEFYDNSFDISSIKLSNNPYIIGSNLQTDVEVHVYRPSDGYSDNFDSIRITTVKSKIFGTITYTDWVGANAADKEFAKKNNGFTLPTGKYNLTTDGLTQNPNGTYSSGHFYDTLRIITNDLNIDSNSRNKVNVSPADFLLHANQRIQDVIPYKQGKYARSAGCNVTYGGQEMHSFFMGILRLATNLSDVDYYIH